MATSMVLTWTERGDLNKFLEKFPIQLREQQLKAAVKQASKTFQEKARSNARGLPHEWTKKGAKRKRGRWGAREPKTLAQSIRRKLVTRKHSVIGRTHTIGQARMYAAPVEYGHKMHLPQVGFTGRKVKRSPFWRLAKDSTHDKIHRGIVSYLRARVGEMVKY